MTADDPFAWARRPPPAIPAALPPVRHPSPAGLEGAITGAAGWVLDSVGLLDLLDQVTGDPEALYGAALRWLAAAGAVRAASADLRTDALAVAGSWDGEAAAGFGRVLGVAVGAVDGHALSLAATAGVLHRAARVAAEAEAAVTAVVADAAEWAAAELAATVVADLLTLGLASVAGALAESATMAAFVARAVRASAEFGQAMELLSAELRELAEAREAIRAAAGFAKLRELTAARDVLPELEILGTTFHVLDATADAAVGLATHLPLNADGPRRLREVLVRSLIREVQEARSGT